MKSYFIEYKLSEHGIVYGVDTVAWNKEGAWERAVFEVIPRIRGQSPYSAWVVSVTYSNGNYRKFNTFEGKPY